MSEEKIPYKITVKQQAASACCGAILTSLLITPFDVVKIRMQVQRTKVESANKCFLYCNGLMDHYCGCIRNPKTQSKQWFERPGRFNTTTEAFQTIVRNEGISSLWSGLLPTLLLALPTTIVYFVAYEQMRNKLRKRYYPDHNSSTPLPSWIPVVSGGSARLLASTLVNPVELIRTKLQSERLTYSEINTALQLLIKQDGYRGFWRGLSPTLLRDVPFSAIYWYVYESIKANFFPLSQAPVALSFWAGMTAGTVAATLTLPFDVIKTLQQVEFGQTSLYSDHPKKFKKTLIDRFREIYKQHGVRGLFAGYVPRIIKVAPACAVMIASFEYGKIFFYRYNSNKARLQVAAIK